MTKLCRVTAGDQGAVPLPQQPDLVSPLGCASGSVTGTAADYARCVVVRLDLTSNNLRGVLPNATVTVRGGGPASNLCNVSSHLQYLRLGSNLLTVSSTSPEPPREWRM